VKRNVEIVDGNAHHLTKEVNRFEAMNQGLAPGVKLLRWRTNASEARRAIYYRCARPRG